MSNKRRQALVNLLKKNVMMKIQELCDQLNASPATIRRDLTELERSGLIKRVAGGAMIPLSGDTYTGNATARSSDPYLPYKKSIARAAVALVKEGDTVFIDAGSTNLQIAELLFALSNISIVTNSVEIAYKFVRRKDISVFVCGGSLNETISDGSVVGPLAEMMISQFRGNICFLGTSGVDTKHGITDPYLSVASIKAKMIENSSQVVLVADHSKFGRVNKAFVASIDKVHHVITNDLAPESDISTIRNCGVQVTLV